MKAENTLFGWAILPRNVLECCDYFEAYALKTLGNMDKSHFFRANSSFPT